MSPDPPTRDFAFRVAVITAALCTVLIVCSALYITAIVGRPLPEWLASVLSALLGIFTGVSSSLLGVRVGVPLTAAPSFLSPRPPADAGPVPGAGDPFPAKEPPV